MPQKVFYKKWENAVQDFKFLRKIAIQNTKNRIKNYKNYKPNNKVLLVDNSLSTIELLNKISKGKISIVNFIDCETFMKQSLNVIFYFPDNKIEFIFK